MFWLPSPSFSINSDVTDSFYLLLIFSSACMATPLEFPSSHQYTGDFYFYLFSNVLIPSVFFQAGVTYVPQHFNLRGTQTVVSVFYERPSFMTTKHSWCNAASLALKKLFCHSTPQSGSTICPTSGQFSSLLPIYTLPLGVSSFRGTWTIPPGRFGASIFFLQVFSVQVPYSFGFMLTVSPACTKYSVSYAAWNYYCQ